MYSGHVRDIWYYNYKYMRDRRGLEQRRGAAKYDESMERFLESRGELEAVVCIFVTCQSIYVTVLHVLDKAGLAWRLTKKLRRPMV